MREKYIDIVKGISILSIVLMHYTKEVFPENFNIFLGSFMITSFYIVFGWISALKQSDSSFKSFFKHRFNQLGKPYIYWTIIILCFDVILWNFNYYDKFYIAKEIFKSVTLRGIGTLWFLPALLGGSIIWKITTNKNLYIKLLVVLILISYHCFYSIYFDGNPNISRILDAPFRAFDNISQATIGIIFGYYAYKVSMTFLENKFYLLTIGVCCLLVAYYFANYYPLNFKPGWSYLAPLIGPLGLIYLFKRFQNSFLLNYFNFWGKNSLNLMVTHYSVTLVIFQIIIVNILGFHYIGWVTLLSFVLSLPIQHLFVFVTNKYANWLLGK